MHKYDFLSYFICLLFLLVCRPSSSSILPPCHISFCRVPKNIFRWQFAWLTKASFVCCSTVSYFMLVSLCTMICLMCRSREMERRLRGGEELCWIFYYITRIRAAPASLQVEPPFPRLRNSVMERVRIGLSISHWAALNIKLNQRVDFTFVFLVDFRN